MKVTISIPNEPGNPYPSRDCTFDIDIEDLVRPLWEINKNLCVIASLLDDVVSGEGNATVGVRVHETD